MNPEHAEREVATPPDDGHRGAYTRLEEITEVPAVERPVKAPALHREPTLKHGVGARPTWLVIGSLVLLTLVVLLLIPSVPLP